VMPSGRVAAVRARVNRSRSGEQWASVMGA
jgi:hypothetical protein